MNSAGDFRSGILRSEDSGMAAQARLLVVDDEPSLQDIVATSMRFLGYQVSTASTGRDAVKAAVDERPDLLILDVMLPDFDGLEVMRRIRAAGVDAGVVFLSAQGHAGRQGRRADRRRRRLRDQAVRPGGTGRPRLRGAAPDPADRHGALDAAGGRPGAGRGDLRGAPRRQGRRPRARPSTNCCAT